MISRRRKSVYRPYDSLFGTPAREWLIRQLDYELTEVMCQADKIEVEPFLTPADERRGEA